MRVEDADGAGLLGGGGRCGGGRAAAGQRARDGFLGKKILLLLYFLNAMSGLYQETLKNILLLYFLNDMSGLFQENLTELRVDKCVSDKKSLLVSPDLGKSQKKT